VFANYTTDRLVELRALCIEMIEETNDLKIRTDTLHLLERIDEELSSREEKLTA